MVGGHFLVAARGGVLGLAEEACWDITCLPDERWDCYLGFFFFFSSFFFFFFFDFKLVHHGLRSGRPRLGQPLQCIVIWVVSYFPLPCPRTASFTTLLCPVVFALYNEVFAGSCARAEHRARNLVTVTGPFSFFTEPKQPRFNRGGREPDAWPGTVLPAEPCSHRYVSINDQPATGHDGRRQTFDVMGWRDMLGAPTLLTMVLQRQSAGGLETFRDLPRASPTTCNPGGPHPVNSSPCDSYGHFGDLR